MFKNTIFVLLLLLSLPARADFKDDYFRDHLNSSRNQLQFQLQFQLPATLQGTTFTQKLNHDEPRDPRTFQQRFFVDSSQAVNSDSPVLYYICGESVCDPSALQGIIQNYAYALHATVIALEHRYYGYSQPFAMLTTENLRYLSVSQALADLDSFQHYAQNSLNLKGPWISIGGSYSGALSAWYRLKYPQNVVGALASSAPVRSKADFEEYDQRVAAAAGSECAAKARAAVATIESRLQDPTQALQVRQLFNSQEVTDPVDFLYVVADMAAFAVQYGFSESFCRGLNTSDPVAGYADTGKRLFQMAGMTPLQDSFQSAQELDPLKTLNFAMRQWMYQSCTQFGFYQIAYHDPNVAVRSSQINLAYHNNLCKRLFGIEQPVDTNKTNQDYYLPLLTPAASHIFFTNGSEDPWMALSVAAQNGNTVNPNLAWLVLSGGSHCSDISGGSSPDVSTAREQFLELARSWITPRLTTF